ncbi:MAG: NAD(P)-dependent oxidoreductase, partial [Acidobacteria bacterium]|nr:NAD(P)-dependent oxidoreductase [Acidobacteriota bacterium]
MKIAVLGAGGQLGQVMAQRAARAHQVTTWTRTELDITRPDALRAALTAAAPDAVINCAAFARVDEAEDAPVEAFAANALALRDLARLSQDLGFTLTHYSTDFVFDGVHIEPHRETDPPNPSGVYATSKLVGEWFAAEAPRHFVLRVESLFGGAGAKSSVDVLLSGLRAGREVRAFAD